VIKESPRDSHMGERNLQCSKETILDFRLIQSFFRLPFPYVELFKQESKSKSSTNNA